MSLFSSSIFLRLLVVAFFGCCFPEVGVAGEKITNDDPAFELKLPYGFVTEPELLKAQSDVLHGFRLGDPDDEVADIFLVIQTMNGTIGQAPLREEDQPEGFKGYLFRPKWQGYEVNGIAVPEVHDGMEVIFYNVQIPLRKSAIQVKLFGPKERDDELSQILGEALANLTGETSWQTTTTSLPTLNSADYGKILLGIAIGLYLVGVVGLWLVSRTGQRGLVLGVGCVLFLIGVSIAKQEGRTRELAMFGGTCSLLGLTGGILGIVDLARKPKKKKGPPEARSAAGIHMQHEVVDAEVLPSAAVDAEVIDDPPRS